MTTVATAEDLTLASDHGIRIAIEDAIRARNKTQSQLLRTRIDAAVKELTEEAERRHAMLAEAREAGL